MTHSPDVLPGVPTPSNGLGPLIGSVLGGRYRIDSALGHGGMADVYRAHDEKLRRPVAVKLFRPGSDASADRARFRSEVRTLAGLSHPNLVALFDSGQDVHRPWCVMQYLDGGTLAEAGRMAPERVARIGAEVCEALAYIHALGIVHRDVKPSNVLLDADGTAYLSDFGVAQIVDATRMTGSGALLGTAAYLSPEQVLGKPATEAVDVYALALVLLETITGEREYPGGPVESAVARLTRPPSLPGWLGPQWAHLLREMTAVEPADRPTASEAATRLRALARPVTRPNGLLAQVPAPGRTAARPVAQPSEKVRTVRPFDRLRSQSRTALAVEAGVTVAAAVLGIGILVPLLTGGVSDDPDRTDTVAVAGADVGASGAAPLTGGSPLPPVASTASDGTGGIGVGPRGGGSGPLQPPGVKPTIVTVNGPGRPSPSLSIVAPPVPSLSPSAKPSPTLSPGVKPSVAPSPSVSVGPSTSPTARPSVSPSSAEPSPDPQPSSTATQGGGSQGGPVQVAGGPVVVPSPITD